ncbi:MAG: LysR family transcriptional regulator [Alphaproteobacteria bacterium]|nr:LysR family transcriptional regulator [Alphaproteobacteria bacterium]
MFEASARHLSFTLAGRELGVTQAAVSQQVRALERELGIELFTRLHRGLELTRQGSRLYRAVSMAFEHVATTADDLRGADRSREIKIGVTFAVATFWLVPRLPEFRALHPDIDVHIVANDRGFERVADQVDGGIAYGTGPWPVFTATLLREGEVFPVCSPDYLRGRPPLTRVEQLVDETLLAHDDDRPGLFGWPIFFAELGVTDYKRHRSLRFNSHPLLLQAACEGQGIALGWTLLSDDLIARGRLVRPLDVAVRTPKSFYLLLPDKRCPDALLAFRDWVVSHFKGTAKPARARRRS